MIAKRGYGPAVDWWATGALLFEMLTGDVPFKSSNTRVLHRKILTEKVIVPNWLSNSTHALVKGLLERNVERRLGSGKSTMFKVPTAPR
jgi:p70 ribosomal S6 kinase